MSVLKVAALSFAIGFSALGIYGCNDVARESSSIKEQVHIENTVMIFFWYGCPHCYAVHQEITKANIQGIKYDYIAVPGNSTWTYHAKIFYTLKRLGKLNELNDKFFDFVQEHGSKPSEQEVVSFMLKNGVGKDEYLKAINSVEVEHDVDTARKLAKQYEIKGVPGIFMDGTKEIRLRDLSSYSEVPIKLKQFYKK